MDKAMQPIEQMSNAIKSIGNLTDKDILRFSKEIENYNHSLEDYQKNLSWWLGQTDDFSRFKKRIYDELSQFELFDWSFTSRYQLNKLGVKSLSTCFSKNISLRTGDVFHRCELLAKNRKISSYFARPHCFRKLISCDYLLSEVIKKQRCAEIYYIPIMDVLGDYRVTFCLTSKGVGFSHFQQRIVENQDMLIAIGNVVSEMVKKKYAKNLASIQYC